MSASRISRSDRVFKWLLANRRLGRTLLLVFFAAGMSYWVLAFFTGIHSVIHDDRQIGYLAAINWSIVYSVLLPLILYVLIDLIQQAFRSIESMDDLSMFYVIDKENDELMSLDNATGIVQQKLLQSFRVPFWIWVFLAGLGLAWSIFEWATTSAIPLFSKPALDAAQVDWAVAAALQDGGIADRVVNAVFALVVFVGGQAVIIAAGLSFILLLVSYKLFLYDHRPAGSDRDEFFVLPSLKSSDNRYGFEALEEFGSSFLFLGCLFFTALYLVVIQNQYLDARELEAAESPQNILEFLFRPYAEFEFAELLVPVSLTDISLVAAIPAVSIILGTILLVLRLLLSGVGRSGRLYMIAKEDEIPCKNSEERDHLKRMPVVMETWPYSWMSTNKLTILIVLMTGGIIFFRLFPALFVVFLGYIVQAMRKEMKRLADEEV